MHKIENGKAGCLFVRIDDKRGNPVPIIYQWNGLSIETEGPVTVPGAGDGIAHVVLVDATGSPLAELLLGHMTEGQTVTFPGGSFIRLQAASPQETQNAPPAQEIPST